MILTGDHYEIRSQNSNLVYWEQGEYPEWTAMSALRVFPMAASGHGAEPHYHDNDEIWLFRSGRGEVWLGDERHEVTPNTAVYTPMGVVHRFQMFEPYENTAIVTPLEGQKRPIHILRDEHGEPVPTASGFVVAGADNVGAFPEPGDRCPLSEFREVAFAAGDVIAAESTLEQNEHWIVTEGVVQLTVDEMGLALGEQDVALMRAGATRQVRAQVAGRVVLVREVPRAG